MRNSVKAVVALLMVLIAAVPLASAILYRGVDVAWTVPSMGLTTLSANGNDTTPPGAFITFDPVKKEIYVMGFDDTDPDVEIESKIIDKNHKQQTVEYTLTDDYGNYLSFVMETRTKGNHYIEITVLSFHSNGGKTVTLPNNEFSTKWTEDGNGNIRSLSQIGEIKHIYKASSRYTAKEDRTSLLLTVGKETKKITVDGMVILGRIIYDKMLEDLVKEMFPLMDTFGPVSLHLYVDWDGHYVCICIRLME